MSENQSVSGEELFTFALSVFLWLYLFIGYFPFHNDFLLINVTIVVEVMISKFQFLKSSYLNPWIFPFFFSNSLAPIQLWEACMSSCVAFVPSMQLNSTWVFIYLLFSCLQTLMTSRVDDAQHFWKPGQAYWNPSMWLHIPNDGC